MEAEPHLWAGPLDCVTNVEFFISGSERGSWAVTWKGSQWAEGEMSP